MNAFFFFLAFLSCQSPLSGSGHPLDDQRLLVALDEQNRDETTLVHLFRKVVVGAIADGDHRDALEAVKRQLDHEIENAPILEQRWWEEAFQDEEIAAEWNYSPTTEFERAENQRIKQSVLRELLDSQRVNGFRTFSEQQEIIERELGYLPEELRASLESKYFSAILSRAGPKALLNCEYFQRSLGLSKDEILTLQSSAEKAGDEILQDAKRLKRQEIAYIFSQFKTEQRNKLSRWSGIEFSAFGQLYEECLFRHLSKLLTTEPKAIPWVLPHHQKGIGSNLLKVIESSEAEVLDQGLLEESFAQLLIEIEDMPPNKTLKANVEQMLKKIHARLKSKDSETLLQLLDEFEGQLEHSVGSEAPIFRWNGVNSWNRRLHAVEVGESTTPTDALKEKFAAWAEHPVYIPYQGCFLQQSISDRNYGGYELLPNQVEEIRILQRMWREDSKTAKSWAERSQLVNHFVDELNAILLPAQATVVFNLELCRMGPRSYFQQPDVAREFEFTDKQLAEFERKCQEVANNLLEYDSAIGREMILKYFSVLSEDQVERAENVFGKSLSEVANEIGVGKGENWMRYRTKKGFEDFFTPTRIRVAPIRMN